MSVSTVRLESTAGADVIKPNAQAVIASLLLCFAISIDDFVVTYFNAGSQITFTLFVWGAARIGAPPQVNVIGTAIFVVALAAMLFSVLIQTRRGRNA